MKNPRLLLSGLGLVALAALAATGCFITSGQILAHFDLPNPFTINSETDRFERVLVDLNTIGEYKDHKDKLKGLTDLAVIGKFTNVSGPAGSVEVWITPGVTDYFTVSQIMANGTRLWGPASIGASGTPAAVHVVGWDESAKLFNAAGKAILIDEAKGDGVFTLYTFGTTGLYDIEVQDGALILVLDAGI